MNNTFGINEMLALLESLRGAVGDFAAREEKLNAEFTSRSHKELDAQETRMGSLRSKLDQVGTQTEAVLAAETSRREVVFQKRRAWLNRAHHSQKKLRDRQTDEESTALNDGARQNTLVAERRRDDELAAEDARYQSFSQSVNDSGATLEEMKKMARKLFGGSWKFRRWVSAGHAWPEPDFSPDEDQLLEEFRRKTVRIQSGLERFKKFPVPQLFRFVPVWLVSLILLAVGTAPLLARFGIHFISPTTAGASLGALACVWIVYWLGLRPATPVAAEIARDLFQAQRLLDGGHEKSGARHAAALEQIKNECEATVQALNRDWQLETRKMTSLRSNRLHAVDEKAGKIDRKLAKFHDARMDRFKRGQTEKLDRLRQEAARQAQESSEAHRATLTEAKVQQQAQWEVLESDWKKTIEPLWAQICEATGAASQVFPDWNDRLLENWAPPATFQNAAKAGRLEVDLATFAGRVPKDRRLAFPGPSLFSVPLALTYPQHGSILFETGKTGATEAVAAINNLIFRLLSVTPPGKLNFTIFDAVGLGQNFAALMHLADYEENSINNRIWTQATQFEEKLAELNEHMEKVIQMYLRNEFATIAEYNAKAGTIAEKYHFLVIAGFPANFSDTAARRLRNIAASGARCGVYTLIQWDQRVPPPPEVNLEDLRKNSINLVQGDRGFEFAGQRMPGTKLLLDAPPSAEFATQFLHRAGQSAKNSGRVEVPFEAVAPPHEADIWSQNTVEELRVPIGRSGAAKLQYLAIGRATRQHALIAGKTGSGKSTLFHVIITNLALWCSPEQVEFYLVDFKKGVEFKCYASRRLPHAKVVAIESDRAFGLSVLQRLDDELRRRGDLFRKLGAQDLGGYQRGGGSEPMPRCLLIIDEFQEFFVEEDRISQGAAVLLDRIVRQGRAFGIHVLLGSQTLGGAYTLARATIGQMVVRIALQCNETDAYLIMDQDNPAPRLLSRPGEGIYNDTAGSIEGNSPFQAVWISDQERDGYLAKIRARADQTPLAYPGPIIFEGNAPADVQENTLLAATLRSAPATVPVQARFWLGAPNSIKGPTEAVFQRQSGNNLLIVGQSEERALNSLALALVALAAQYPPGQVRFVVLDSSAPGAPQREFFQQIIGTVAQEILQASNATLNEVMAGLATELKNRSAEEAAPAPEIFLLIHGLQNFKKLRAEDEFSFSSTPAGEAPSPAAVLLDLIREGPARGIHVLATCDTYNSVNRFLSRKALSEFEMRMLFQMSAADSASLIDDPAAANLGFYRALLYQDREGTIETFRPYAQPGREWVESVAQAKK